MEVVVIRVSDFLFNMGNTVFNVKDIEYRGSHDLDYEESNTLPINKVFYSLDKKTKYYKGRTSLLMTNLFSFFINSFFNIKFKPTKKVQKKLISNYCKSDSSNSTTAHSVVSNNVRNRLLKTINEGISINNNKVNSSNSVNPKKLKNQFKSDMIVNDEIEDESYKFSGILNRLSSVCKKTTYFLGL